MAEQREIKHMAHPDRPKHIVQADEAREAILRTQGFAVVTKSGNPKPDEPTA